MDVARGDLDLSIMNPSALLTQAYRGTGLFSEALPVRVASDLSLMGPLRPGDSSAHGFALTCRN